MQVFSSELLTRKFYSELSDWYAWAVQVARFPNDLATTEDDEKFNHESCIRLITRLIFVWFLKQKHLIPEEFFDENYIREHFIENFDPHDRQSLYYNAEESKYYRLILQNLFFAMLNRPIVPEGKDTPNNRRFRVKGNYHGMNPDYAVNNLLRYEGDFKDGGAAEFLAMANSNVPFLNGGLFDCLDDKPKNLYYDGFSERRESLEQLYLPDWLFFGEEVGKGIDLSQWYDDAKKRNVSARGIIDILKRYNFTIEENTPLDQEVSLDPELLGKAFENLLASYNPETKTSARKQTGSFYTPREIVQYMVDESLVAHLKRICGDELEPQYRSLLSYATEETTLNEEQRRSIMQAIYNCRVLDPACGSGAFPMGVLQQMVHILRQLDPTNEMWKDFMIDIAIDQSRKAFNAEEEEERKARLADIEEAFNRDVNDPDYARKLYLIEHCIYGVDIQPIAIQISKLRFFISLVVDQKPTDDATHNFGIRPLPNLESKFVAANTLIPVEYDASLFESTEAILSLKESLKELNHAIFLAKRNIDKQRIKTKIKETRKALAHAIEDTGFVNPGAAQKLADWDMFEQNTHADFFDAEWMFGVKGGFDIVIGNPPYISAPSQMKDSILAIQRKFLSQSNIYRTLYQKWDLYIPFMELGTRYLCKNSGIFTMIVPFPLTNQLYSQVIREEFTHEYNMYELVDLNGTKIFENATVSNCIPFVRKERYKGETIISKINTNFQIQRAFTQPYEKLVQDEVKYVWNVSENKRDLERFSHMHKLGDYCYISKGMCLFDEDGTFKKTDLLSPTKDSIHCKEYVEGKSIEKYNVKNIRYLEYGTDRSPGKLSRPTFPELYTTPKIVFNILGHIVGTYDDTGLMHNNSLNACVLWNKLSGVDNKSITMSINRYSNYQRNELEELSRRVDILYLLGVMNSKCMDYVLALLRGDDYHIYPEHVRNIPIPSATVEEQKKKKKKVNTILEKKKKDSSSNTSSLESEIDRIVYHLYGLTYDEVLIIDPTPPFTQEEYEQDNL